MTGGGIVRIIFLVTLRFGPLDEECQRDPGTVPWDGDKPAIQCYSHRTRKTLDTGRTEATDTRQGITIRMTTVQRTLAALRSPLSSNAP